MKKRMFMAVLISLIFLTSCDFSSNIIEVDNVELKYNTLTINISQELDEDVLITVDFDIKSSEVNATDFGNYYTLYASDTTSQIVIENLDFGTEYSVMIIEIGDLEEEISLDNLVSTFDIFIGITASVIDENLLIEYSNLIQEMEAYDNLTVIDETILVFGNETMNYYSDIYSFIITDDIGYGSNTTIMNDEALSHIDFYVEDIETGLHYYYSLNNTDWQYMFDESSDDELGETTTTSGTDFDLLSIVYLDKEVNENVIKYTAILDKEGIDEAYLNFVELMSGEVNEAVSGMAAEATILVVDGKVVSVKVDMVNAANYYYMNNFEGIVETYEITYTFENIGVEVPVIIPTEIEELKD